MSIEYSYIENFISKDGYGIIYIAESPSNKIYVGQTIQNFRARVWNHFRQAKANSNKKISRAIRKYGKLIKWKILYYNVPLELLDAMERWMISSFGSFKMGYNMTEGGIGIRGVKRSENFKKELSSKYVGENNPFFGKHHSWESKRKKSESSRGQLAWNKGIRQSDASAGKRKKTCEINKSSGKIIGKLNINMVKQIREDYNSGQFTYRYLAKKFGVTSSNIAGIVKNKIWKDDNFKVIYKRSPYALDKYKVNEIASKYKSGNYTYNDLAAEYGINRLIIWKIIKGRYYYGQKTDEHCCSLVE